MKAGPLLAIGLMALAAGCGGKGDSHSDEAAAIEPARVAPDEVLSRDPYMGVSCPTPNSFACDRVGLAVWLREPALRVDAAIAGRELALDDPEWSEPAEDGARRMFAGFLQPAGLIDGPLEVTADAGSDRWIGRDPMFASVDLRIERTDCTTIVTTLDVGLSPGWG
jgi:hypothetical protein